MLSGRNVIIATVTIAVISMLAATASLSSPGEKQVLGANTYGVRGHGHRGLFEILEELDFDVSRSVTPPRESGSMETTLAFLEPDRKLIEIEPAHLLGVAEWVKAGGTVVYAPTDPTAKWLPTPSTNSQSPEGPPPKSFEELIGIPEIDLSRFDIATTSDGRFDLTPPTSVPAYSEPTLDEAFDSLWNTKKQPTTELELRSIGKWRELPGAPSTVAVPQNSVQLLQVDDEWPSETNAGYSIQGLADDEEYWLAASFPVGEGNVIVVSDASIAENALVARQDNAILIVSLLASGGDRVIFDEFYHGLTSRGNPLVLLQRPGFATLLATIFLSLAIYSWRHGQRLGPAIAVRPTRRRSLSEYVNAMARLFVKSRDRNHFLIHENREGLNWMLRRELGIRPSKHVEEDIYAMLTRRDTKRAETYKACLATFENILREQRPSDREVLDAMRKVEHCL